MTVSDLIRELRIKILANPQLAEVKLGDVEILTEDGKDVLEWSA